MAAECLLYRECSQCGVKPTEDNGIVLFRCSACRLLAYCSQECQLKNWPKHTEMCGKCTQEIKRMKRVEEIINSKDRFPRMLAQLKLS